MATVKDLIEYLNTIENPESVEVSVLKAEFNQYDIMEVKKARLYVGNLTETCTRYQDELCFGYCSEIYM